MRIGSLLPVLLLTVLLPTPLLAIGTGPPVAGAGGTLSLDANTPSEAGWHAATAPGHVTVNARSCEEALRGFRERNTLRPSVRRAALARCGHVPASFDESGRDR